MEPCMRCARLAPLTTYGLLQFCAACAPTGPVPPCTTHDWHGTGEPHWLCSACGAVLLSDPAESSPGSRGG